MDLFSNLTDAQREAVEHVDGPLLILAGPGSGKTRVVTHRIAHLLRLGVPARQILALTFTNKAAEEMKGRVALLAPGAPVWVSTFHRFCARLLREHAALVGLSENYTIYDTADSLAVLKRVLAEEGPVLEHITPQQVARGISDAKNALMTAEQYRPRAGHPLGSVVARVYPAYQARLLQSSAVDFDDLLLHVAMLLRENPELRAELDARYRYVLVDEYQDTNLAQYAIARGLSLDYPNLAVTGDPDQSIYGWRGANLRNILDFEHDYPHVRVVRLEQNYRSTKRILHIAAGLIAHNRQRKVKALFTENAVGAPVRLVSYGSQADEARGVAARIAAEVRAGRRRMRDFAVFYRVNALSRELEHALSEQGLRYQIAGGVEFYQRKEIKDLVAYLTLLNNPRDDVALLRIINTPSRGISKATVAGLAQYAARRGLTLLEAARESGLVVGLPKKAPLAVAKFVSMYDRLSLLAARPVEEILGHVLAETHYAEPFQHSEAEDDMDRAANIGELLTAARQFDENNPGEGHLEEFLEQVCLVNDTDDLDTSDDCVSLMTLHASKGLEFPVVFLVALEEGLIPHQRSREDDQRLEEERRLLFVGLTRAREELHLSYARLREFQGLRGAGAPSSFLMEMPRDELEMEQVAGARREPPAPPPQEFDEAQEPGDELPVYRRAEPAAGPRFAGLQLTTAAQLASGGGPQGAASPDDFSHGMIVLHPDYGIGKIVALSGAGAQRKATVAFAPEYGQRSFVLRMCPLTPVKGE